MSESAQEPRKHFQISPSKARKIQEIILEGVNETASELDHLNAGIDVRNIMSHPLIVRTTNARIGRVSDEQDFGDATIISLDLDSGCVTVEVPASEEVAGNQEACCSKSEGTMSTQGDKIDQDKLHELQARVDDLLAGRVDANPSGENNRHFAPFLPDDKIRASALSALCKKIAKEQEGLKGLEAAIDRLYESLEHSPFGMVEYATKLFLTHYQPARELLQIRSLEERQPGVVLPSLPGGMAPR